MKFCKKNNSSTFSPFLRSLHLVSVDAKQLMSHHCSNVNQSLTFGLANRRKWWFLVKEFVKLRLESSRGTFTIQILDRCSKNSSSKSKVKNRIRFDWRITAISFRCDSRKRIVDPRSRQATRRNPNHRARSTLRRARRSRVQIKP